MKSVRSISNSSYSAPGGIYLAVTRVSTSKITNPYSDWWVKTDCDGAAKPFGLPLNVIYNLESTSRLRNLSLNSVTFPISIAVCLERNSCTNWIAKGVAWRRAEGGVEPTCTSNTVNFLMSYWRPPAQKQFIAKVHA